MSCVFVYIYLLIYVVCARVYVIAHDVRVRSWTA